MAVAKEQIRQIISENNISSVADDFLYFRGCIFDVEDTSSLYTAGGVFFLSTISKILS